MKKPGTVRCQCDISPELNAAYDAILKARGWSKMPHLGRLIAEFVEKAEKEEAKK